MLAAPRRGKKATPVALLTALVFVMIATVAPALASAMTFSPPNPVAGDTVTATDTVFTECYAGASPTFHWTFTQDGSTTPVASGTTTSGSYSAPVPSAGNYTVTEHARCSDGSNPADDTGHFAVGAGLNGSISVSPDPPVVNQPAALSAAATGGNPGYGFFWDLNNHGTFGDSTARTPSYTFTTPGLHTVKVQITDSQGTTDSANPAHTTIVTKTINVVAPTPSPTTTTTTTTTSPTTPPPCIKTVTVKLSEFTTDGCFTRTQNQWTTTSAITFNGISMPDYGQTFTITNATTGEPGGHFTAPNSTMQLNGVTVFSGNIDWSLPDGTSNPQVLRSFSVANGAKIAGFQASGQVELDLGQRADGSYYSVFGLNLDLPVQFTAGPDPSFGGVSAGGSLTVDDAGVHLDGLKVQAHDVWLGKLKVASVCFSYVPSGGTTTAPCDAPSFGDSNNLTPKLNGDEPFLSCNTDPTTNRWDGSAVFELPSKLQLGAYGGVADGQITKLGGSIGNLEKRVPLAEGMYLDHVSFGLCLSPPPFRIRANVGANFEGNSHTVSIDGGFTYTDAYRFNPWSLQLDGSVSVADTPVGSATLGITGAQLITFSLQAGFNFENVVSLNGSISGWVDAPHRNFVVAGEAQACLFGPPCVTGSGEISSVGVAGCIQIGGSYTDYGTLSIDPSTGAVHLGVQYPPLTAGFGYRWGASSPDVLGNSCDFSSYEPALGQAASAAAARAPLHLRIARGTTAVTLRVHGTHGPPKLVLRGPHGPTIVSPAHARGVLRRGRYVIAENKANGTTNVVLIHPAGGTWTVSRSPGSASAPTRIDRANLQPPPSAAAHVFGKGAVRTLRVAYAVPAGASLRLVEHGRGALSTLAAKVHGRRCKGLPRRARGTGQMILCASIRFRPSHGPGGLRKVQAVITRRGVPLLIRDVASFRAPRLMLPAPVRVLRVQRGRGGLLATFSPSAGASRYSASAQLSDGRKLAFDLGATCRTLRIANVPSTVAGVVKIAGVRYDFAVGRLHRVAITSGAASAGTSGKTLRLGKVCT